MTTATFMLNRYVESAAFLRRVSTSRCRHVRKGHLQRDVARFEGGILSRISNNSICIALFIGLSVEPLSSEFGPGCFRHTHPACVWRRIRRQCLDTGTRPVRSIRTDVWGWAASLWDGGDLAPPRRRHAGTASLLSTVLVHAPRDEILGSSPFSGAQYLGPAHRCEFLSALKTRGGDVRARPVPLRAAAASFQATTDVPAGCCTSGLQGLSTHGLNGLETVRQSLGRI